MRVDGNRYSSSSGNGRITYFDDARDVQFSGGPLDGQNAWIYFDEFGQTFELRSRLCFQHGSSLERGFNRFLLNTPELTDYFCRHVASNDEQVLTFLPNGRYRTSTGSGRFSYSEIIADQSSKIEFDGGPLNAQQASYTENPITGRQEFNLTATRTFGANVAASTSTTYVCARNRTPRPYKQYGFAAASRPTPPAVLLSGSYYVADIKISASSTSLNADYYQFTTTGFVTRFVPHPNGHDCNRTAPNGLNYCESYMVQGGNVLITNPENNRTQTFSYTQDGRGTLTQIGGDTAEVLRSAPPTLNGAWSTARFSSSGGCIGSGCSAYSANGLYLFTSNNRFLSRNSSLSTSEISNALGTTSTTGGSSNENVGQYEIRGNRLLLSYDNGKFQNRFLHYTGDENLAIDNLLYTRDN